jgi:asparagine synthase (glutamine-hydrolysing)
MCGILAAFGNSWRREQLCQMLRTQKHRGPDAEDIYISPSGTAGLGHNRLSIIDLSEAANQPMSSRSGGTIIVLNGEIYNYIELKRELESEFEFRTRSDTEVLLAAYEKWGAACLDKLIGMFAFIVWDEETQTVFAARDRFGVKPLYYHQTSDGTIFLASEIKTLHAAGVPRIPNEKIWATYLASGLHDHTEETFWTGVFSLPAGHVLTWKNGDLKITRWYDLLEKTGDQYDDRTEADVIDEYFELMKESVTLRFRSDVSVGINLSGGLDSSSLLGLVHAVQGADSDVKAFTFVTGNNDYDELPWVEQMLAKTNHSLVVSHLSPQDVPELAADVQRSQDEPFSGIPTLAYAKLFEEARERGVIVLLDGNGMDEQWAGYDYYRNAVNGNSAANIVQGTKERPVRPECLDHDFASLAEPASFPEVFPDRLRNLQYRDTRFTKIPRAMRFNDRVSMRSSTELREPFLDHRLFELAFRQPADRKIDGTTGKKLLRRIAAELLPGRLSQLAKRPIQTPQREWLKNELKDWADGRIRHALVGPFAGWLDKRAVLDCWRDYCLGKSDNSFYVWQWITLSLTSTSMENVD